MRKAQGSVNGMGERERATLAVAKTVSVGVGR
jgi:hypothetical protein